MVFSSLFFLFVFLPLFLVAYYLTPRRFRNYTALLASYLFYAWGAPQVVLLLFVSSLADYLFSRWMARKEGRRRKQILWISLFLNFSFLAYFKYANFFVVEAAKLFVLFGFGTVTWIDIALPIGISFWTFQKMSYMVDVYKGTTEPAHKFSQYALFVALFPQLIAGPIVRYHDIAQQLVARVYRSDAFAKGMWRFCVGLSKKVLIADQVGRIADVTFGLSATDLTTPYAWLGAVAYAMQIYFDFSGYSDMAIGLGKMMGFTFPENFNWPYSATNFTDFWRRWHMTLSAWMREYLYIPLGGNRVPPWRKHVNLWVVFLLSGLWHGAAWTFVLWGAYHGLFLSFDKYRQRTKAMPLPRLVAIPLTFIFVLFGWVLFRAETLTDALTYLGAMFGVGATTSTVLFYEVASNRSLSMLVFAGVVCLLPVVLKRIDAKQFPTPPTALVQLTVAGVLLLVSAAALANSTYTAFLYFRF